MALNSGLWLPQDKPDYPELDPLDPINRDLVSFWPLGEGRGKTARDICAAGNHGTLTNLPAFPWFKGRSGGQALSFAGTNQNVRVLSSDSLQSPSTEVTICAWFYVPTTAGSQPAFGCIAGKDYVSDPRAAPFVSYSILASGGAANQRYSFVTYFSGAANDVLDSGVAITKGVWAFVCGVMLGATKSIYINGVLKATNANGVTLAYNGGRFSIGTNSASQEAAIGYCEGVRVLKRALTPSEVYRLYTEQWAGLLQVDTTDYRIAAAGGTVLSRNYYDHIISQAA